MKTSKGHRRPWDGVQEDGCVGGGRRVLRSNPSITIKPADKGGAVVVWHTDLYITEASHQLYDTSSYRPLNHDPTPDHQTIMSQTIHNLITSVQELLTYDRDTTHALHLLQDFRFPGPQHLIFTVDIQSLDSCFPHADGLKALCFFLSHRLNKSSSTDTLIRLTELVLTLDNFSFNSSHFLQTKG
eukprot:g41365.t1